MLSRLEPNDLIYICSPAKSIEAEQVQFAKKFFEQNNYRVEVGKHALGNHHYFSGSVEDRLTDFQTGLDHPEAKVILCARGGYGCMQILDQLDWSKIEENPKYITGFSDITTFHLVLAEKNIPSLHATMPLNFKDNTPESLRSLLSVFSGKPETLNANHHIFNQSGIARGKIIGGNLAMVHALIARLDTSIFQDNILFLEDVGENLYQVDRMLFGLKYAGVFEKISGLVLGGFTSMSDTDTPFGKSLEEIIVFHVAHRKIPIGFNLPCGHQNDNQALILNKAAVFTVDTGGTRIHQNMVENLV